MYVVAQILTAITCSIHKTSHREGRGGRGGERKKGRRVGE